MVEVVEQEDHMTIGIGKFTKDDNEEGVSFYGTLP